MTDLTFAELREANLSRCARWHPGFPNDETWTVADWSNAIGGESGELLEAALAVAAAVGKLQNTAKKVRRYETGTNTEVDKSLDVLWAEMDAEMADVACYLDLLATKCGRDLAGAIVGKFNSVSQRQAFPERLGLHDRPPIIAVSGYARAGKDTVGRILTDRGFTRIAFADMMRESLYQLDPYVLTADRGWTSLRMLVDAKGWEWCKESVPMVRAFLQRQGEGMKRALRDETVCARATLARIIGPTVVTDCRFPVEAEAVRALGGEVWRVERPGCEPVNGHHSETALDSWAFDRTIRNTDTVELLAELVDAALTDAQRDQNDARCE